MKEVTLGNQQIVEVYNEGGNYGVTKTVHAAIGQESQCQGTIWTVYKKNGGDSTSLGSYCEGCNKKFDDSPLTPKEVFNGKK